MFRKTVTAVLLAMAVLLAAAPAQAGPASPAERSWVELLWSGLSSWLPFFKSDLGASTDPDGQPSCSTAEQGLGTDPNGQAAGEEGERGPMTDPDG